MSTRRGLTLFETLVVLGLLAALATAIFSFLFNLLNDRERLWSEARRGSEVSRFLDMLEGDLLCVTASASDGQAGVKGDGASLELLTRRVWIAGAASGGAGVLADLESVEFRFDEAAASLAVARAPDSGEAIESRLIDGVAQLRFRYFDGSTWSDTFDSDSAQGLPSAVSVALWFGARSQDTPPPPDANDAREPLLDGPPSDDPNAPGFEMSSPDLFEQALLDEPIATPPDLVRVIAIADGPTAEWRSRP